MKAIHEYFHDLLEEFKRYRLPAPEKFTHIEKNNTISFSIDGPKNSVAFYRVWGPGVVDVWFGKSNDDSGGLALQGSLERGGEQLRQLLKLHSRFYGSGRRKVLSRFSRNRWSRRR